MPYLPKTSNSTVCRSSVEAVLGTPELLTEIIMQADPAQHDDLARVCRNWGNIVNSPPVWERRYGPCIVSHPRREIYTCAQPMARGHFLAGKGSRPLKKPLKKKLGSYGGEVWTLCAGATPDWRSTANAATKDGISITRIIDRVTKMREEATLMSTNGRVTSSPREEQLECDRIASFAFLCDRAYRLKNNINPPRCGWGGSLGRFASAIACVLLPLLTGLYLICAYLTPLSWAGVVSAAAITLVCGAIWPICVAGCLYFTVSLMTYSFWSDDNNAELDRYARIIDQYATL